MNANRRLLWATFVDGGGCSGCSTSHLLGLYSTREEAVARVTRLENYYDLEWDGDVARCLDPDTRVYMGGDYWVQEIGLGDYDE